MLGQRNLRDSLSLRFAGPFYVIKRRGPDVKLQLERREKWVDMDNVKSAWILRIP